MGLLNNYSCDAIVLGYHTRYTQDFLSSSIIGIEKSFSIPECGIISWSLEDFGENSILLICKDCG